MSHGRGRIVPIGRMISHANPHCFSVDFTIVRRITNFVGHFYVSHLSVTACRLCQSLCHKTKDCTATRKGEHTNSICSNFSPPALLPFFSRFNGFRHRFQTSLFPPQFSFAILDFWILSEWRWFTCGSSYAVFCLLSQGRSVFNVAARSTRSCSALVCPTPLRRWLAHQLLGRCDPVFFLLIRLGPMPYD